jgi:microcystin-dependent protein
MTQPFLGEVQIFGFNFAPRGWTFCNGALIPIQQASALFSLIGTQYGGNGTTNFQLPNLMNRAPCNQGQGPGLTPRTTGEVFGEESVTLTLGELPMHNHFVTSYSGSANRSAGPTSGAGLSAPGATRAFLANPTFNTSLSPTMVQPSGGGQPHENRQPFLALTYAIALEGVFPSFG